MFYDFVSSATLFIRLENKTKNLSILNLFFLAFFFLTIYTFLSRFGFILSVHFTYFYILASMFYLM